MRRLAKIYAALRRQRGAPPMNRFYELEEVVRDLLERVLKLESVSSSSNKFKEEIRDFESNAGVSERSSSNADISTQSQPQLQEQPKL